MRRYGGLDTIATLDIETFISIVRYAREEERDELIRRQWLTLFPYMSLQQLKYMSFEDYKNKCLGKDVDTRPVEEILAELEELHGGLP